MDPFRVTGSHTRPSAVQTAGGVFLVFESGEELYGVSSSILAWETARFLFDGYSPSLVRVGLSTIWLFYIRESVVYYRKSIDEGVTFSAATVVASGATAVDAFMQSNNFLGAVVARSDGIYLYSEEDSFAVPVKLSDAVALEVAAAGYSGSEGNAIFVAYVVDYILYTTWGVDALHLSTPIEQGDAQAVDVLFLQTGHLVLVADRGWHLWGMVSSNLGNDFWQEWDVLCFPNYAGAAYPALFCTENRDLYIFASVLEHIIGDTANVRLGCAFLNFFAYISEVLPLVGVMT